MQVCLEGHKITDLYSEPQFRQSACEECGSDTIHQCPKCETNIKGRYKGGFSGSGPDVKDFCHGCGEPYPWADEAGEFTEVDSSVLDDELVERSVSQYESGHYQSAVQSAFIILEERVRDRGGFGRDIHGSDLMTESFTPDDGPLSFGETGSEQQGVMFLYRGAMQSLRNPASHRFIEEVDEDYARDVIHTVNLLLRLMETNTSSNASSKLEQHPESGVVDSDS
ncbi:TIGR02391 family protein [Halorubrum salipaludis]|uniref:TIGR02391 family protein n=2 Tax=Halorubrum salipaludis TaxID=2032630 RepID=A0A2A2F5A4_9EURY|nr:TIGR02391 family protein [Halorubrum salipaludis]